MSGSVGSASAITLGAAIIAGGQGTRLGGVTKSLLVVDGVAIVDRQLALLAPWAHELVLAVSAPAPWADDRAARVGARVVIDAAGARGPLAGIAAALAAARADWMLVVGGDMPWLSAPVLALVREAVDAAGADVDAVVPRVGGFPEPLLAAYRARAAAGAAAAAGAGLGPSAWLRRELTVAWIEEAAVRAIDPELRALRGVNTAADLTGS
ncbi:MAG: NTP transferase domain-containing protein [Kofleriaceae bacterium]|nr:NTP transferase domain-containing protein [Kofleriaceae bacterium]